MSNTLYPAAPVLIVDDEEHILKSLSSMLRASGINNLVCCQDSGEALELLSRREMSVILLDLTMPYVSGEELLPIIRLDYPDVPIIIITGNHDISTAVECMKMGAFDYLVKAIESSRLKATVGRAIEIQELKSENSKLKKRLFSNELEHPEAFAEIITADEGMLSVFLYIESIAGTNKVVLITGETGVGKELVARAVHVLSGRTGKFLAVNVAGFDDAMFADTLFGHKRGAYTGANQERRGLIEMAAGGTLFLDEIGDLRPLSQVKLLRLLEMDEYFPLGLDAPKRSEARIIAATNRDLHRSVETGEFRTDLFYRLRTHCLALPPLRERMNDLPRLIDHFLAQAAEELGKKVPALPPELYTLLGTYSFPGNVRELKAVIFDAVSKHRFGVLSLDSIKKAIGFAGVPPARNLKEAAFSFPSTLPAIKQMTELLITEALRRSQGNQSIAARLLGISQQALSKRLKRAAAQAEEHNGA
jgi:DNA-binding NtrC family response regulator